MASVTSGQIKDFDQSSASHSGYWVLLGAALACSVGVAIAPNPTWALACLAAGLTFAILVTVQRIVHWLRLRSDIKQEQRLIALISHDAAPCFATDAFGQIGFQNTSAQDRFAVQAGATLVSALKDHFASPSAVLYRLQTRAAHAGAMDFLEKPVEPDRLQITLRNALQASLLAAGPGAAFGLPASFRLFSIHGAEAFGTTTKIFPFNLMGVVARSESISFSDFVAFDPGLLELLRYEPRRTSDDLSRFYTVKELRLLFKMSDSGVRALLEAGVALADQRRLAAHVAVLTQVNVARVQLASARQQFDFTQGRGKAKGPGHATHHARPPALAKPRHSG